MFVDYVINGAGGISGHGEVGQMLDQVRFDPGMLRPYKDRKGRRCVTVNTGRFTYDKNGRSSPVFQKVLVDDLIRKGMGSPVMNAASLRREEWIQMDQVVVKAARQRLRAWDDLAASNTFGGFNGMAKLTLEYEAMSDPGEAVVDMDGLADARNDSPLFKTRSIPLPITHSDFWFSARRLAVSRNTGTPLDTTMAEAAGRRVAEMIEKTTIGVETGVSYGKNTSYHEGESKVYGYTNFPYRMLKTDLTTPTGSNPEAIATDILEMREQLYAAGFYGPFMVYHTPAYDLYLDSDYFRTGGTSAVSTVRERVNTIEGISGFRRLDFWTGSAYQIVMVQMTPDVARAINGMDITTVQWESKGGMMLNFKVMCIMVPQLRHDYNQDTGILHATTA